MGIRFACLPTLSILGIMAQTQAAAPMLFCNFRAESSMNQTISDLAYALWQSRGCPEGTAESDWAEAERQFLSTRTPSPDIDGELKDSFPASDPPASHIPDEPPINAGEKWAAAKAPRSKKKATSKR
jgi:hypothetical protein